MTLGTFGYQGAGPDGFHAPAPTWNLDRLNQRTASLDGYYGWAYTGRGVAVYVIDSGVTPIGDIAGRVRENRSFVTSDTRYDDCFGHGTYVADVIGGNQYGVAKEVTVADAIDAMVHDHVTYHPNEGAVANLSLYTYSGASAPIDTAILNAISSGITVVVIAGNIVQQSPTPYACDVSPARDGNPSSYPTSVNPGGYSAITVGATDGGDRVASFSKIGQCVDIFAPGDSVPVMRLDGATTYVSGTSFAAPHVAGVAAMHIEGYNLANQPAGVQGLIKDNATFNALSNVSPDSPNVFIFSGVERRRACCAF
jgi:subtilisin family serine protease